MSIDLVEILGSFASNKHIQGDTKKRQLLKNPTKIEEFIDKN